MNNRARLLLPHVFVMVSLYALFLIISATVFGYDDLWAAFAIAVAILFGYKPTVVALGIGPEPWVEEIQRRNNEK